MTEPRVTRSLSIPYSLYQELEKYAKERGVSIQNAVLHSVKFFLESVKVQEPETKPAKEQKPIKKQKKAMKT